MKIVIHETGQPTDKRRAMLLANEITNLIGRFYNTTGANPATIIIPAEEAIQALGENLAAQLAGLFPKDRDLRHQLRFMAKQLEREVRHIERTLERVDSTNLHPVRAAGLDG